MAQMMMFGALESKLPLTMFEPVVTTPVKLTTIRMAPSVLATSATVSFRKHAADARIMLEAYERSQKAFEQQVERMCAHKLEALRYGRVKRFKNGCKIIGAKPEQIKRQKAAEALEQEQIRAFLTGPERIATHMLMPCEEEKEELGLRKEAEGVENGSVKWVTQVGSPVVKWAFSSSSSLDSKTQECNHSKTSMLDLSKLKCGLFLRVSSKAQWVEE